MMSRYNHLLELIDEHKPCSIVEIGVWNGANAIRMINRALRYNINITYTGYDLFEDASEETDAREFNVKGHNSLRAVAAYIKAETGIVPVLIKGDTNETLKYGAGKDADGKQVDFVFLDGGHSVETIAHDYATVRDGKLIVLDDYYTDGPDTSRFGCNNLVGRIKQHCTILPTKDPVRGGGFTQLVVVKS